MKTYFYIIVLLLSGIPGMLSAQHVLRRDLNLPRAGEEIIKQQVEYKNPGRAGENVLWDFGQLQSINDEYRLSYSEPVAIKDSIYILGMDTILVENLTGKLLVGTEHYTMYYYYISKNRMLVMGHENPTTLLQYAEPLIASVYPMQYGDSCRRGYQAKGMYSSKFPFTSDGEAQIKADAYGMMILPSGDTLRSVLRTHTTQTIRQVFQKGEQTTDLYNSSLETFKWFSKGYRYPIFETIRSIIVTDSTEIINFETAFFYPPQEHYYLKKDLGNQALLDSVRVGVAHPETDPWAGLTYNMLPNPVKYTPLEVEIYLPRPANIRVQLRNSMGLIVKDEVKGSFPTGVCSFQVETYSLTLGNYILDIWLNEKLISEIIMKRN